MKELFTYPILASILVFGVACTRVERPNTRVGGINGTPVETKSVQQQDNSVKANSVEVPTEVIAGANAQIQAPKPPQTLHVFIENSGSMNGYINKASDFQMAIGRAIQLMRFKYGEANIKTYYINQNVRECARPEGTDIFNFVKKMLEKKDFTTSGTGKADRGTTSTDLNEIVKRVLGYVDENNTAVLISDFIYSLSSTNGVTTALLYDCQNLTMSAFLQKTTALPQNVSLATNLIQLYSNFEGKYWTWAQPTGTGYVSLNCARPYFMCVLGTDENVKEFNHDITIDELRGYKNQFTISNKDVSKANYTVLDTKYRIGSFKHSNKENSVHALTKAKKNNVNAFEFGIGIDLSDFSMSESDKLDPANYKIEQGDYQIAKIELIDTTKLVSPKDKMLIRNNHCTHAIVVSCTGFPNNLSISIKRDLPLWVRQSSSVDDRNIRSDQQEQLKTFGLAYFVEGISDAYKYLAKDKSNFMTINVSVTK